MGWPTISRPAAYATHPRWRERRAATQAQRGGRPTVRAMTQEPTSSLRPYPGNARRGDVDMIARSLEQHGQYKPIAVNKGTKAPNLERTILAGNHTWEAAKQLGWEQIDVHGVDVDKHQARDIVLIDNKANDSASYDVDALVDMLTEYPDLSGTGFTRDELDTLLESLDAPTGDDAPDMPADEEPAQWNLLVECATEDEAKLLKSPPSRGAPAGRQARQAGHGHRGRSTG